MVDILGSELTNFPDLATFSTTEVIERAQRLVSGMLERGMDAGVHASGRRGLSLARLS